MPIDRIEDYYLLNRALAYIFTEPSYLPYVLLAAEKTAWELSRVVCVQDGLINNQVIEQSNSYRQSLEESDFYYDTPALRPVSEYLNSVEAQLLINQIAETLSAYESRAKRRVSPASVTTFLGQFPSDLQRAALEWLKHIRLVFPDEELLRLLPNMIKEELSANCRNIGLSPLGATTDSASHIAYDLRGIHDLLPPELRLPQLPMTEALGRRLDAYIIYDDNVNSGLQAVNIVAAWLGRKLPPKLSLKEEHVQKLQIDIQQELLRKPVIFVFSVATENATAKLKNLLIKNLGFDKSLIKCVSAIVLPKREKIFSGPDSPFEYIGRIELREYLKTIGTEMLISEGKKKAIAESRCLGYNQAEAMVVFPYNCPTMSIPALWIKGNCKYGEWIPLVERGRRHDQSGNLIGEDA